MIELSRELMTCMAISWTCFAAGVWILSYYRTVKDLQWLGKGLVLMCPAILSAFSTHSVRECERVILAKKAQGANHGIYLAATITEHYGDGYGLTGEWYTDGTARFTGQMPTTVGRMPRVSEEYQEGHGDTQGEDRGLIPLSPWSRDSRNRGSL